MESVLQKVTKEMKFVVKDEEWYKPIYFDEKNNRCVIRQTAKRKNATAENTKTYEEACALYNIEFASDIIMPDQYFLRKIKEKTCDPFITVTSKRLINYVKDHKAECEDVISKLKEIVMTHENARVRRGAYETLECIQIEDYEALKKYLIKKEPKKKVSKSDESLQLNNLDSEKALIVYMSLVKKYKDDRTKIICSNFIKEWDETYPYNRDEHQLKVSAHKQVHITLDEKSLDEIQEYRNTFAIYDNTDVPEDIKRLAQEKRVFVLLAGNRNKHLSGFDVQVKEEKMLSFRINDVPFGLTENSVRELLQKLPTKSELKIKESGLIDILSSNSIPISQKKKAVKNYKALYSTHNFKVFLNKFTIVQCKDKELTLLCVYLCNRCGIRNLQNNAPIKYNFCEGSGKRTKTLKRIKARRKGNAKAAKRKK